MKTRFAPSPTGDLHIGGARTALFNYLAAKHAGGEFHLRIEDTDEDRNSEASLKSILEGLFWLGIPHDGEIVYQAARSARHAEIAKELVARGKAYYCYMTQEELAAEKAKADAAKRPFKYDRRWRPADGIISEYDLDGGIEPSIRLKMPLDGRIGFNDTVRGNISIGASELEDFVIMRSDETPTYMLAVVVDDHDMGITNVVRGEDHITNTYKQIEIYKALDWDLPQFSHIPLIHNEKGEKYSKRHGAPSAFSFRNAGYIPEAVCSYLVGLGWGKAEDFMTMDEMIAKFDLNQVGKSPSRFDTKKLDNINYHFLQKIDNEALIAVVTDKFYNDEENLLFNQQAGPYRTATEYMRLTKMMPQLKERAKTKVELYNSAKFLFLLPAYDDSAKTVLNQSTGILYEFLIDFARYKLSLPDFATKHGFKVKDVSIALRAALCGSKTSSGSMDSIIDALGHGEVMSRIRKALETFQVPTLTIEDHNENTPL